MRARNGLKEILIERTHFWKQETHLLGGGKYKLKILPSFCQQEAMGTGYADLALNKICSAIPSIESADGDCSTEEKEIMHRRDSL